MVGANRGPWNAENAQAILFAELSIMLPQLEAKGVVIPADIQSFADQALQNDCIWLGKKKSN